MQSEPQPYSCYEKKPGAIVATENVGHQMNMCRTWISTSENVQVSEQSQLVHVLAHYPQLYSMNNRLKSVYYGF